MPVKKRCFFCGEVLRKDGTCPNSLCPRYEPEKKEEPKNDTRSKDSEE